jgi:glycosyltransferase involved in cell wall biosynthesis
VKIGLNATCLNDRPSGARQRFIGIYGELVRRMPEAQFIVYEPEDCRVAEWLGNASNVTARRTPLPSQGRVGRFVAGLRYWRSALAQEDLDVFEGFNLPLVRAPTGHTILTIHDTRGLQGGGGPHRFVFRRALEASLAAADQVIAVSETVRKEILEVRPTAQVAVVYNGLDASCVEPLPASALEEVRLKLHLPDGFILAVGHLEPRKNYIRLLEAMAALRDRSAMPPPLVIIGNDSGELPLLQRKITELGLSHFVRVLRDLSDVEVRCAYQLCRLFVFPSTYEGFGIPILEAMAAGCPMVLSDLPVFREITQDQSLYFSPHDPESIANAIATMLASDDEGARLVKYGKHRVGDFDFRVLSTQVEAIYMSLASSSSRSVGAHR